MAFEKIIVANRGEIAVRVMRTARAMGYRTVAVFSEADAHAPHVREADEAVCIGEGPVADSYLSGEKVLAAAKQTGADALHPGYGFLSENGEFAEACHQAGITFIGPPAAAISLMGSKRLSKIAMQDAGVPCIPGYEGAEQDPQYLAEQAKSIGFPLMIKASAGGGGRGMRFIESQDQLQEGLQSAASEAQAAFGSGELILEKALLKPRHIEIQVFADQHGNAVHLGERDCSIQRRHQKVVEEAPSPFVNAELRERMGKAAVDAAKACNYVGAGTVEFLVDDESHFYFLEMNTRLQVEHPVTELITGLDLVEWQLRVAAGETLPLAQGDIKLKGHAMEVRLYAEDSRNQFMPQTGSVLRWQPAQGQGVRVDSGIQQGQNISAYYDPMLAKIIAWGKDREEARRRLLLAIEDSTLFGVTHNKDFLAGLVGHSVFKAGQATTDFIPQHFASHESMAAQDCSLQSLALAAILFAQSSHKSNHSAVWSSSADIWNHFRFQHNEQTLSVRVKREGEQPWPSYVVEHNNEAIHLQLIELAEEKLVYQLEGVRSTARYLLENDRLFLSSSQQEVVLQNITALGKNAQQEVGSGVVKASMDGAIVAVHVAEGDQVSQGQTLVVLEAMKMEHQLKADVSGVVESIHIHQGDQVKSRALLVQVKASD